MDFVAEHERKIVGHVTSTRAKIVDEQGKAHDILCLGPICVSPEVQGLSIGSQLIEHTKNVARDTIIASASGMRHNSTSPLTRV